MVASPTERGLIDRTEISQTIIDVIYEAFSLTPKLVRLDEQFWEEEIGIGPIELTALIEGLEHQLGIEFTEGELEQFTGFDAIIDLLATKLAA